MNRPALFASTLLATVLLAAGAGDARADGPAPPPVDSTAVIAPPATAPAPAPVSADGGSAEIQPVGDPTSTGSAPPAPGPAPPATGPAVAPPVGAPSSAASPDPPVLTEPTAPAEPATQAPAPPEAGPVEPSRVTAAPQASVDDHATPAVVASVPVATEVPKAAAPASRPAGRNGVILERLLPDVERRLRAVQAEIGRLQRRLAVGAPPPRSLLRLRLRLEHIAPALLALEARVAAAGPLSPRLRQLLRRVHTRFDGTRASAAALETALRRSGLHGAEVRLLLRELDHFQALPVEFARGLDAASTPAAPDSYVAAAASVAAAPAPAAPGAAPPERRPSDHGAMASGGPRPADGVATHSSAAGAASAGPGGGLFLTGLGALGALLGGLALPRLLSRVQVPATRRYAAAFLVPLERPG